ncbi:MULTISPECIES: hypothetical protein [Sphingomonas]|uniref:Uncharacterized protein n=1 Tax=Sphingomonas molluscorum TaxID=418184 RepID=A0ABU8Q5P1_9SPHN|nr:hypothetical protein [Sphingomonas sp. JUb134]MBM7406598.1 hypothetical protein [Sphingomonas sp. JUb134]
MTRTLASRRRTRLWHVMRGQRDSTIGFHFSGGTINYAEQALGRL